MKIDLGMPAGPADRGGRPGFARWRSLACAAAVTVLCYATPSLAQSPGEPVPETAANEILLDMSNYLAKVTNLTMSFSSDIEVISHGGQTYLSGLKLQFNSHGTATLSRPSKLRATRTASYGDIEIISDGKKLTVVGKRLNAYAQADASPTVDMLIDDVRDYTGAEFPGADLLFSNVYAELSEAVEQGIYVGADIIDGIECHHLAFRTASVDWQIWIQKGDKPIPRKYIITSKWVTGAPQYELRITDWNDNPALKPDAFAFRPAEGAKKVDFGNLEGIADLPLPVAIGGR